MSSFAVVLGLVIAAGLYRELGLRGLWDLLTETNLLGGMIFFTFAGATLFSWALSLEGVPDAVAAALEALGAQLFLPAVIAITIVLGALLDLFKPGSSAAAQHGFMNLAGQGGYLFGQLFVLSR